MRLELGERGLIHEKLNGCMSRFNQLRGRREPPFDVRIFELEAKSAVRLVRHHDAHTPGSRTLADSGPVLSRRFEDIDLDHPEIGAHFIEYLLQRRCESVLRY